jgi:hypothetical protein
VEEPGCSVEVKCLMMPFQIIVGVVSSQVGIPGMGHSRAGWWQSYGITIDKEGHGAKFKIFRDGGRVIGAMSEVVEE